MLKKTVRIFTLLMASMQSMLVMAEAKMDSQIDAGTIGSSVTQPSEYFGQIVLSLVLVLLIIFISAWLLRRYGRFPGVADGNLKVLGALSVGQRERILLLQVGKDQVLVGVTSSKITRLHQLEEPIEVAHNKTQSGETLKSPFSQRLQEALKSNKDQSKQDGTHTSENH